MIKKSVCIFLSFLLCLSLASCSDGPRIYSHCELSIQLPESFYEYEDKNFDVSYTDGTDAVAILRISFDAAVNEGISNLMTAYEFGEYWISRCQREANLIGGDTVFCDYFEGDGASGQYYLEAFYRSKHAYFVVLFATAAKNSDKSYGKFLEYAGSVNLN